MLAEQLKASKATKEHTKGAYRTIKKHHKNTKKEPESTKKRTGKRHKSINEPIGTHKKRKNFLPAPLFYFYCFSSPFFFFGAHFCFWRPFLLFVLVFCFLIPNPTRKAINITNKKLTRNTKENQICLC